MDNLYLEIFDEKNWKFFVKLSNLIKPLLFGQRLKKNYKDRTIKLLNSNKKYLLNIFNSTIRVLFDREINDILKYYAVRFYDIHGKEIAIYLKSSENDIKVKDFQWGSFAERDSTKTTFTDQLYRQYYYIGSRKIKILMFTNDIEIFNKFSKNKYSDYNIIVLFVDIESQKIKTWNGDTIDESLNVIINKLEEMYFDRYNNNLTGKIDIFYSIDQKYYNKKRLLCTFTFSLTDNSVENEYYMKLINKIMDKKIIEKIEKPLITISTLLSSSILATDVKIENKSYIEKYETLKLWDKLLNQISSSSSIFYENSVVLSLTDTFQKLLTPACKGRRLISNIIFENFIIKFISQQDKNFKKIAKILIEPLEKVLDFDDTLKLSGFRDHFIHSFHVFLIGLLIWPIIKKNIDNNGFEAEKKFLKFWFLTALWHDISYPITTTSKWINDVLKGLIGQKSDVRSFYIHTDIFGVGSYHKALLYIANNMNWDTKLMINKLTERLNKKEYCDHGLLSAILLIGKLIKKEINNNILEKYFNVFIAIAIHDNFWQYCNNDSLNKPLSILLALSDEIHSWGRDGENDLKLENIIANNNRIVFTMKGNKKNINETSNNYDYKNKFFNFNSKKVTKKPTGNSIEWKIESD